MASRNPMKALSHPDHDGDPFTNFTSEPPKPVGPFRSLTRKNKYRSLAGLPPASFGGSNSSLATLSGSSQNLLDAGKMMSMQEDAKSRSITAAVMKNRLYESVISQRRRRYSNMGSSEGDDFKSFSRMVQSLPVTPAHSHNVTPSTSPKSKKRFSYGFFSHTASPVCMTPEEEDMETDTGLACIFSPQPRFVAATKQSMEDVSMDDGDSGVHRRPFEEDGMLSPGFSGFKHPGNMGFVPKRARRDKSPVTNQDLNVFAPNDF